MTYAIAVLRRAQRELQRLPHEDYERVREAIRALAHNPRPSGCLALTILHVGHRRDVYR